MLTILKGPMKLERKINDIKSLTDTSDGIYIKFGDDTELIIPMPVTGQLKTVINTLNRVNVKKFVLNLDSKDKMLSIET